MAITLDATTANIQDSSTQEPTCAYGGTPADGAMSLVLVGWASRTITLNSVTDQDGNTYSQIGSTQIGAGTDALSTAIFAAPNCTFRANEVVTLHFSAAVTAQWVVVAVSGAASAAPVGDGDTGLGSSSQVNPYTVTTSSLTPSQDGSLLIGILRASSIFTVDGRQTNWSNLWKDSRTDISYYVQPTAAAEAALWSFNTSEIVCAKYVVIKPAGGGGSTSASRSDSASTSPSLSASRSDSASTSPSLSASRSPSRSSSTSASRSESASRSQSTSASVSQEPGISQYKAGQWDTSANWGSLTANYIFGVKVQTAVGENGFVDRFWHFAKNGHATTSMAMDFAVYADNGSGTAPAQLLGYTNVFNWPPNTEAGWLSSDDWVVRPYLEANTIYWLAVHFHASVTGFVPHYAGAGRAQYFHSLTAASAFPDPFGAGTANASGLTVGVTFGGVDSPSASASASTSPSTSESASASASTSPSTSESRSESTSGSLSESASSSGAPGGSTSASSSESASSSLSASSSASLSASSSTSPSTSESPSESASSSLSESSSASASSSLSSSGSSSSSESASSSRSASASSSRSESSSSSASESSSNSTSESSSASRSESASTSDSASSSLSASGSASQSASASALEGQRSVPDADLAVGAWTNELDATTNLYQSIGTATATDSTYIKSEASPNDSVVKFRMSPIYSPGPGAKIFRIRGRWRP